MDCIMRNVVLLGVLLTLFACSKNKLEVEGCVRYYPEGMFCLIDLNGDTVLQAKVENGRFSAREEVMPGMYWLNIGAYSAQRYLDGGKVKIEGNVDETYSNGCSVRITGLEEDDRLAMIRYQIEQDCYQEWKNAQKTETDSNRLKENDYNAYVIRLMERKAAMAVSYVQKETSPQFAATLALLSCGMSYETTKQLYDALSDEGKNSVSGQQIKKILAQKEASANGKQAPDFEVVNEAGETVRLSDFRGKVVVLDVWASWCGPCREEIPHMKKVYERFACPELVFMSVAMEDKEETWRKASAKENIPWLNLWDPDGFKQSKLKSAYGFSKIPFVLVVDRNGKIVQKGLIRGELSDCLEKLLKQ